MKAKKALKVLRSCSYKPGWKIDIIGYSDYAITIVIYGIVKESHFPFNDRIISGGGEIKFPFKSKKYLLNELRKIILKYEIHELNEFFKYKDKQINNPHE